MKFLSRSPRIALHDMAVQRFLPSADLESLGPVLRRGLSRLASLSSDFVRSFCTNFRSDFSSLHSSGNVEGSHCYVFFFVFETLFFYIILIVLGLALPLRCRVLWSARLPFKILALPRASSWLDVDTKLLASSWFCVLSHTLSPS